MKHLRQYIKQIITEIEEKELTPEEEVANIMQIYDAGREEQAIDLAYMIGPEIAQHPDLRIWSIYNVKRGEVRIKDLSYDQAMDPKYQGFAKRRSGYFVTLYPDRKKNPWGDNIFGASARKYPPSQLDFDEMADELKEENLKPVVTEIDEESFAIGVEFLKV